MENRIMKATMQRSNLMFRSLCVIVLAGLAWATSSLHSGEEPTPRSIIDRAIKAHGGEANLAKYPSVLMKGTGTFYGLGEGIAYTGQWAIQGTTQQNSTIEVKVNNMSFKFQRVVNGDKGWIKQNEEATVDMAKDELAEEKERLFMRQSTALYPLLKDMTYNLALIGEAKVGEKKVIGIRVTKKGHRDVNLYFDKQTGMLARTETNVKDFQAGGEEYTQTTTFKEYKSVSGIQCATKVLIERDGKRLIEGEMTEVQPMEKLENNLFQRP
jgi:hypothetical protein